MKAEYRHPEMVNLKEILRREKSFCKNFREVFRSFREVFQSFRKFFEVFASFSRLSDPFGPIGMHSEAIGSVWTFSIFFLEMVDFVAAIDSVKNSSRSVLSLRFFGRLKFWPNSLCYAHTAGLP